MLLSKVAFKSDRLLLWIAPIILFLDLFVGTSGEGAVTTTPVTGSLSLIAGVIDGPGQNDGPATEARFSSYNKIYPFVLIGIASDLAGDIYMADWGNHSIRKITPNGLVTTLAGIPGKPGSADGIGTAAHFNGPSGLAIDKSGNLYVAEMLNHTIRKITPSGIVSTLAGAAGKEGNTDGIGSAARFRSPQGIAIDRRGDLYVVDNGNYTIRKITPIGAVTTFAGKSRKRGEWGTDVNGIGPAARFADPHGVTIDAAGNIYVSDFETIRKILPTGAVSTFASMYYGPPDVEGEKKFTKSPAGITVGAMGNLYVTSANENTIYEISPSGAVTAFAGVAGKGGSEDGVGLAARFHQPLGITADAADNLYVADVGNPAIRKITPAGVVTTYAGKVRRGGYADGVGAAARFNKPSGIAADSAGNLYVADRDNHVIRKITPEGFVSTLAGKAGKAGKDDGAGELARFHGPRGITVDGIGNIYVADSLNNTIRKITRNGMVTTIAGCALSHPVKITADTVGNLYVSDSFSRTIRKIKPEGVVSTFAGGVVIEHGSVDGSGQKMLFFLPEGLTTDGADNLYVSDSANHIIRKVTPAGDFTTVAGLAGRQGIVTGALPAGLDNPIGLTRIGSNTFAITTGNAVLKLEIRP